jgi:transcriptional regulator with XRE-family HTH domain
MPTKSADARRMIQLRRLIKKSQSQFAAMIGVSIHTVISVENGRNQLSENLARRIEIATGADLRRRHPDQVAAVGGGPFTNAAFEAWRARFSSDKHNAEGRFNEIKYWIELVLKAAAKPGRAGNRDRLPAVYMALTDWLAETRKAFKLEQEIDEVLEEEPHEIINVVYDFDDLTRDKKEFEFVARMLETTPKELLGKFHHYSRGLKPKDQVQLHASYEMRRAWNPFTPGLVGAFDECKVKKLLPRPKFEFKKADPARYQPVSGQAQPTPPPDVPAPPARS